MKHAQLKKKILQKYGTVAKFCRLANLDHYYIKKMLMRSDNNLKKSRLDEINRIDDIIRDTKNRVEDHKICMSERLELKQCILSKYDGQVEDFCTENGFNVNSVYQILNGRRKTKTAKSKEILKHGIDIEL